MKLSGYQGIKSFLRIRPLDNDQQSILQTQKNNVTVRSKQTFNFDKIFTYKDSNQTVFQTTTAPMIDNSISGFNSCILAYGQTCSGKTYTMKGIPQNPGIIPLSVRRLFQKLKSTQDAYQVKVSYFQIYNQNILDLLSQKNTNLDIREDINKNITIVDLTQIQVKLQADALSVFEKGQQKRKFSATSSNHNSSRSHTIFQIQLTVVRKSDYARTFSQINMVDLAGSQGVSKTKAQGAQKREGDNINRSLLSLSNVIRQLSQKAQYVNFRDSKLTRILQSSLVTNSKSVVICTIFPTQINLQQTLNTLKFGTNIGKIRVNSRMNLIQGQGNRYQATTPEKGYSKSKKKTRQIISQQIESMEQQIIDNLQKQNQSLKNRLQHQVQTNRNFNNEIHRLTLLLVGAEKKIQNYQASQIYSQSSMQTFKRINDERIKNLQSELKDVHHTCAFYEQKFNQQHQLRVKLQNNQRFLVDKINSYEQEIKQFRKIFNKSIQQNMEQNSKTSMRKPNATQSKHISYNKENKGGNLSLNKIQDNDLSTSKKLRIKRIQKQKQIKAKIQKFPDLIDPFKLKTIVDLKSKILKIYQFLYQAIGEIVQKDNQIQQLKKQIEEKQDNVNQGDKSSVIGSKKIQENNKGQVRSLKKKLERLKLELNYHKKRQRKLNEQIKRMKEAQSCIFDQAQQFLEWRKQQAKKMDMQNGFQSQAQQSQIMQNYNGNQLQVHNQNL